MPGQDRRCPREATSLLTVMLLVCAGEQAAAYVAAGMTTDHECFTKEEAIDKIAAGLQDLHSRRLSGSQLSTPSTSLLNEYPQQTMLCSDDKHPDELLEGHINALVRRAVQNGIDVFDALQAACINPIEHYGLNVGRLRVGDPADFIEIDSLEGFNVTRTWIDGQLVAEKGVTTIHQVEIEPVNRFVEQEVTPDMITAKESPGELQVIEALDGQLITNRLSVTPKIAAGQVVSDVEQDVLKMVVVNRYQAAPPAVAFVKNFGLTRGAMASSVAHDSHNVIAVGVDDEDLSAAINAVMQANGGLSAVCRAESIELVLPLPVAGLMATGSCEEVGSAYQELDAAVKQWGSQLRAPYMTLSFMALLVIPELKLSDLGLFDGGKFAFTPLFD